jgi:hypothetical protein
MGKCTLTPVLTPVLAAIVFGFMEVDCTGGQDTGAGKSK